MTKAYPTSAEQTLAADNAPLNPRLLRASGDARTEERPAAPLETVSVDEHQWSAWPAIWGLVVIASILLSLLYVFG